MKRPAPHRSWRWWAPQIVVLTIAVALAVAAIGNLTHNLARRGISLGFAFLNRPARFPISESLLPYTPLDAVARAFAASVVNTFVLTVLIIVFSTLAAVPLALARRSHHPLAATLATALIELVRNSPLIVQLLFWYGALTLLLPSPQSAWEPLPGVFLTGRGVHVTALGIAGSAMPLLATLLAGLGVTAALAWRGRLRAASAAVVATAGLAILLWAALGLALANDIPRFERFNYVGGTTLSPEFAAVLIGSALYAAAFAAEIMRGGIDAVSTAQWEAGAAVGLSERQTLRLIVMPQALRIMIPPMTNNFISILKNSTLAMVIGFPEANFVASTTINHTGQALEGVAILIAVFLILSGLIAVGMGRLNAATALVGRQ
ncbi:ABC transporter permease subunit [Sphingomonadaceae bacterium OTU29THOMA1]|nr:ABC transporter permease subunit [Sphingomonadaceae bacterium OTU29THOMA1]